MKGFARALVLKQRHKVTQRKSIENRSRGICFKRVRHIAGSRWHEQPPRLIGFFFFFFQSKSEERSQALAMLMLQYCAGYQSCVEAEELDSYQL